MTMTFAKPSWPQLLQLRERLIGSQGFRSITEYMTDIKGTSDEFTLIDNPVSNDDITLYIINGLSNDFKELSAVFRTQETSVFFDELYEKLIEHLNYIKRIDVYNEETQFTAHTTNQSSATPNFKSNNFRNHQTCFYGSGPNNSQRIISMPHSGNYKGHCQLCSTQGHSARFYHLLRQEWTYSPSQQQSFP